MTHRRGAGGATQLLPFENKFHLNGGDELGLLGRRDDAEPSALARQLGPGVPLSFGQALPNQPSRVDDAWKRRSTRCRPSSQPRSRTGRGRGPFYNQPESPHTGKQLQQASKPPEPRSGLKGTNVPPHLPKLFFPPSKISPGLPKNFLLYSRSQPASSSRRDSCPDWCGSVGRASSSKNKRSPVLDSWLGYKPWVAGQVPSWGRARGNPSMFLSHIHASLPLFLSSPLSRNK